MNIKEATKASKNGAVAAFISGGVTLLIVLYAVGANTEGSLAIWKVLTSD